MNLQDTLTFCNWVKGKATLNDVTIACRTGVVGNVRFTEQARRAFILAWTWSAPRFSGEAGIKHDRAYKKLGAEAYYRRIERCNNLVKRICG